MSDATIPGAPGSNSSETLFWNGSAWVASPTGTTADAYWGRDTGGGPVINNSYTGTANPTFAHGRGGADTLDGGGGNDVLVGGTGTDQLIGGSGADTLFGGDAVVGGTLGNPTFSSLTDAEADTLIGGTGDDTYILLATGDTITENPGEGTDTVLIAGTGLTSFTLGSNLENLGFLDPASTTARAFTGNALDNSISGGAGADTLSGEAGNDTLVGGDGADSLNGGQGNDSLEGGDGADTLIGGDGLDVLRGGAGDDRLVDSNGATTMFGEAGADTLIGNFANDSLDGGADNDRIEAGGGNDTALGGGGNDTILGGDGNDSLDGGDGADSLDGGNNNDTILGGDGADTITGFNGNDSIAGGGSADSIDGGSDADTILGEAGADTLIGGFGADLLDGGDDNDRLDGGSDADTLLGGAGDDTILGGFGTDSIDGGTGADSLLGGGDADTIVGGGGADTILGEDGNDVISVSGAGGRVDGGNGADLITVGAGTSGYTIEGGAGADTLAFDFSGTITVSGNAVTGPGGLSFTANGMEQIRLSDGSTVAFGDGSFVVCFAAGTRILTARGEVAVERLVPGELVATAAGRGAPLKPVVWVGRRHIALAGHPQAADLAPVRIRAGALAANTPHRDLLVSPDHCLFLDGALVPARLLVNGSSITVEQGLAEVTYLHIELDGHDVVLAEGAPAESWLDAGNRAWFENAPVALMAVRGGLDAHATQAATPCAPVVQAGPRLAALRDRINLRAKPLLDTRQTREFSQKTLFA